MPPDLQITALCGRAHLWQDNRRARSGSQIFVKNLMNVRPPCSIAVPERPWYAILCEVGINPMVLSHHCRGLTYSRPKCITLDAADIRPSNFLNCLTVSERPSLTLLTEVRIDSNRAGNICACIMVGSHTTPR